MSVNENALQFLYQSQKVISAIATFSEIFIIQKIVLITF